MKTKRPTGFKDITGREILEGDIIRDPHDLFVDGLVYWDQGYDKWGIMICYNLIFAPLDEFLPEALEFYIIT